MVVLAITSVLFLGSMFLLKVSKESIRSAQCLVDKLNAQIIADSTVEAFKFLGSTGAFRANTLMSSFGDDIGMKDEIPLDGTVAGLGNIPGYRLGMPGASSTRGVVMPGIWRKCLRYSQATATRGPK